MSPLLQVVPCTTSDRQRGVILPIVLVVMMIVTTLVLTHVRRGVIDERLAANWSSSVSNNTVTESLLRQCEAAVFVAERHGRTSVLPSGQFTSTPAWASPLQPNQYKTVPAVDLQVLAPGASSGICIIEDATEELLPSTNYSGPNEHNRGAAGIDPALRKYRFTTVVVYPDSTGFGGVTYRSQSEIRWMIGLI
jgi:hypothetical protein